LLEAGADFDADAALVGSDEQQHAVVAAGLSHAPPVGQRERIGLDLHALEGSHGHDDDLIGRIALVLCEQSRQAVARRLGQQVRLVDDTAGADGKDGIGARGLREA